MTAIVTKLPGPSNDELLDILQSSLYPGANRGSIQMVLAYCKASGLDPMQKPVHIVPMWDSKAGQMRDVVMPGVALYRTQAARNGHAGTSEPEFGPDVTESVGGVEITYPSWCRVTVKRRQPGGQVDEFTAREFWKENYAIKGGKEKSIAPNAMWTKRPYGQLAKCAEAQALRKAFPELASAYTAEEMEGKDLASVEPVEDVLHQDQHLGLTPARAKVLRAAARAAIEKFNVGDELGAYEECEPFQADSTETLALWSVLKNHSALRASLKKTAKDIREKDAQMQAATDVQATPSEPTE